MKEEGSIKVLSAVFLVLTGILLGLSIGKIFTKECPECKKCENVKEPTNVEVKNKLITYYKNDDRTIYLYGLEDFKFNDKSLKEYDSPFNEITNIIKGYTFVNSYDNNEVTLYSNDTYNVLICNKTNKTKDIYIGDTSLKYQTDYCNNETNIKTISYQVINIEKLGDYNYLTLKSSSEIITIKSKETYTNNLLVNNVYKFTLINNELTNVE